jgi:hypothetical protein
MGLRLPARLETAVRGLFREQAADRKRGALSRISVVIGRHLDCGMTQLRAPRENAFPFHDGVTEQFSQFVNFLPCRDAVRFQPLQQRTPVRLTAVAHVRRRLPFEGGLHNKTFLAVRPKTQQLLHEGRIDVNSTT